MSKAILEICADDDNYSSIDKNKRVEKLRNGID